MMGGTRSLTLNVLPLRTCSWVWSIHPFFLFSLGLSLLMFFFVCLFVYFTGVPITWAPFTLSGVTCLFRLIILNRRNDLRLQRQCIMNYLFSHRKSKASDIPTLYFVVPWLWETKKKKRIFKVMMYNEITSRCFKSFFHCVVEWEDDLSFVTHNVFTVQWFLHESGKLI